MIFINYRIDDSNQMVALLKTMLDTEFGSNTIFRDKNSIKGGEHFPSDIEKNVLDCCAMLVVIGKRWKLIAFEEGKLEGHPRLDDPNDWVRREIALALQNNKFIIPVLLDGAQMPSEEWLASHGLKDLFPKQAVVFRADLCNYDFEELAKRLRAKCTDLRAKPDPEVGVQIKIVPSSDSIREYLVRLAADTAHLKLLGMGLHLQIELPISEAFIPLQTTLKQSIELRHADRFQDGSAEFEQSVELRHVFECAKRRKQRGVILLGEPGSGKTTGARQIAWQLASGQTKPEELGLPTGITPVFLRFRRLTNEMLGRNDGLCIFLIAETHSDHVAKEVQSPGMMLWAGTTGLLWILDGLDEVVDPEARKVAAEWIRDAIKDRVNDWFLVTSRFQGYFRDGVSLGPAFVEFHVRPLDNDHVKRFIICWFKAAYGKLKGPGPEADENAAADSGDLLAILEKSEYQIGRMRELATNPLLLTILCIVFQKDKKLPTGRAELYAHCIRVLLDHWRRDLYPTYDADAAQAVLARIAWWMHQEQNRTSATLAELAIEAERGLADVSASAGLGRNGAAFIDRMRNEFGILAMTGDGEGRCGFLHLTFQEYLAADYAARENRAKEVAKRASESWWHEVALLSLRRSKEYCKGFFTEMVATGLVESNPDLADRCLNESLYFVAEPFLAPISNRKPANLFEVVRQFWQRPLSPRLIAGILRLLRGRANELLPKDRSELEQICRRLMAMAPNTETDGYAREVLSTLGVLFTDGGSQIRVDERTGITFIEIPAGTFEMGDNVKHTFRLTSPFWVAKYPVTNAQYELFLKSTSSAGGKRIMKVTPPKYWDDRRFNQPEQPVVGVSWDDAQAYCQWARCRLPTEAEWEYACRAGSEHAYCFGDDESLLGDYAWFDANSNDQTQPVGTKKPNAWGLHDMHGNVWEWCQDLYGKYPTGPVVDPEGPPQGSSRVFRGGGWGDSAAYCRAAIRAWSDPALRSDGLGFRLCLSSAEPTAGGQGKSR